MNSEKTRSSTIERPTAFDMMCNNCTSRFFKVDDAVKTSVVKNVSKILGFLNTQR